MITTTDIGHIPAKAAKAAKVKVAVSMTAKAKAKVKAITTMDMARVAAKVSRVARDTKDGANPHQFVPAVRMCC